MQEFKYSLCLALGVLHPDILDEMLTEEQFLGWLNYYHSKPFGHWIDTELRASLISSWTGQDHLPRFETAEQKALQIPGASGALAFLESIENGDHSQS